MEIKKYSDLASITDNTIVDLGKLSSKDRLRVIDFLAGLTFKNGSLIKIECNKFLVKLERN